MVINSTKSLSFFLHTIHQTKDIRLVHFSDLRCILPVLAVPVLAVPVLAVPVLAGRWLPPSGTGPKKSEDFTVG